MLNIINSFFCSISAFFFNNIITFILFILFVFLLYFLVISKLNNMTRILFYIFITLIVASGIVLILLPSKENIMSSVVIDSYYFGPIELVIVLLLFISMLLSKFQKNIVTENNTGSKIKLNNIEINEKKKKVKKEKIKEKVKEKVKQNRNKKSKIKE